MTFSFVCGKCKKTGRIGTDIDLVPNADFIAAKAYNDERGLLHSFVYCRTCYHINVVVGRGIILGALSCLFKMAPFAKRAVIPVQDFFDGERPLLQALPPAITETLIDDAVIKQENGEWLVMAGEITADGTSGIFSIN